MCKRELTKSVVQPPAGLAVTGAISATHNRGAIPRWKSTVKPLRAY